MYSWRFTRMIWNNDGSVLPQRLGPTTMAQIRGDFRIFGENHDTKTGVHGSTVATKTVQVLATAFRGVKAWKNCSIVALKHLWAASRNQPQHDTVPILSTSPLALFLIVFSMFFPFLARLQDSFLPMPLWCTGAAGPSTSQLQQGSVWRLICSSIQCSTQTKILLAAGMEATEEQSFGRQMGPPRQASWFEHF